MFGLPLDIVALLVGAIFLGSLAKGVTGVALPIVTLSIALNFVEPRVGLALLSIPIVVSNIWQSVGAGNILRPIRRFWLLAVFMLIGLYIGSRLVAEVESWVLFGVIGSTAVIFCASQFFRPHAEPLSPRAERIAGPAVGIVSGLMGGMTSVWGPPIMMYLFMLRLDKDMWVQAIAAIYLLGAVPLAIFYFHNGILAGDMIWLSLAACIPSMIGVLIGERIRRYIDDALFRKILLAAIFVAGLNMIRRAVMGM